MNNFGCVYANNTRTIILRAKDSLTNPPVSPLFTVTGVQGRRHGLKFGTDSPPIWYGQITLSGLIFNG